MMTMMTPASHHGQCLSSRGRKHFFKTGKLWSLGKHCCSNLVVILITFFIHKQKWNKLILICDAQDKHQGKDNDKHKVTLKTSGLQPVAHLTIAYMSQAALLLELWFGLTWILQYWWIGEIC